MLGSILAAFYRSSIVIPNGVSAVDAQAARDTLGGAVEVSSALPGGVGEVLLESARNAFDSGVTVTSWFAAAMMIVAITVTLLTLRKARG